MSRLAVRSARAAKGLLFTPRRHGYIVLVPEIPTDTAETNPLLNTEGYPRFSSLDRSKCVNGLGKLSLDFESGVWGVEHMLEKEDLQKTFTSVLEEIESYGAPLESAWGIVKTLYAANANVMPNTTFINISDRARRARVRCFRSRLIYDACQDIKDSPEVKEDEAKARLVHKFLLEGRLNGLELNKQDADHFEVVMKKLNTERKTYEKKVQVASGRFKHIISDLNVVRDFPRDLLTEMSLDRMNPDKGPWAVTFQPHIYSSFMENCPVKELRWNAWHAHRLRASVYQDKELNNSVQIEEIRSQRNDQAKLLGYKNYVELSMETKMAENVDNVRTMIDTLRVVAKPAQKDELAALLEFSKARGFQGSMEQCDIPYWRRKQHQFLYSYDENELREHLPLPRVLLGLFTLCEDLFDLVIDEVPGEVDTWHPDVKMYRISDDSGVLGNFYLDPYQRPGEKLYSGENSGWVIGCRSRSSRTKMEPLASMILNLAPPQCGIPSLLTLKQVEVLFRKFGQVLQHVLSTTEYNEVSGRTNIEWDALGICPDLLVHWLYEGQALADLSYHYKTDEPLALDTVQRICRSRMHMIGYDLCQELYLSALDIELYSTQDFWLEIVRRLWPEYYCHELEPKDSHPCTFTDIFSGDWAAAYYSHMWSRLVAADVFNAFLEVGINNEAGIKSIGKRFKKTFLSSGGGLHPRELFRLFRGRDPSTNALIYTIGFKRPVTPRARKSRN